MQITKLHTLNNLSYFEQLDITTDIEKELGFYSKPYPVSKLIFRELKPNAAFDWHNAPQAQYIVYLEGKVEVEASGGETRVFGPGDILLAMDLSGKGHISRVLTEGRSLVVTLQ